MFTSVNMPGVDEVLADDMKLDGYFCFGACAMCLEFAMMNALCRIYGLPLR